MKRIAIAVVTGVGRPSIMRSNVLGMTASILKHVQGRRGPNPELRSSNPIRPREKDTALRHVTAVMLVAVLSACGGLSREDASRMIAQEHFRPDQGIGLTLKIAPSAFMLNLGFMGSFSTSIGNCAANSIGWTEFPSDAECIRGLAAMGVVESSGTARTEGLSRGPSINKAEPLTSSCGSERFGRDADREYSERVAAETKLNRDSKIAFVAKFSPKALPPDRCENYLKRSGEEVLRRAKEYGARTQPVGLELRFPGSSQLSGVTGVADGPDGLKVADFTWTIKSDMFASASSSCVLDRGTWPNSEPRKARATFRKFDDGWRIDKIEWGP